MVDPVQLRKAAEAIVSADIMVVGTGAGLSAESGLGLYQDAQKVPAYLKRNLDYIDLCTPDWNFDEPETFYGFWGKSMNDYRAAIPHEGYDIVRKWRDQLFSSSSPFYSTFMEKLKNHKFKPESNISKLPGPFFVYTSNVDALHLKAGFKEEELYEIHGNIETWQCSRKCTAAVWDAPADFVFKVDEETMFAHKEEETKEIDHTLNNGFVSNHPRCRNCGDHARPSILMFGDRRWTEKPGNLYYEWRRVVYEMLRYSNARITVLEIGSGENVPSVRWMSEGYLRDFPGQASLVRINPEHCYVDRDFENPVSFFGLQGYAKATLKLLDEEIQKLLEEGSDLILKAQNLKLQVVDPAPAGVVKLPEVVYDDLQDEYHDGFDGLGEVPN